jgi:predicted O-methyltransferase YrrM
MTINIMFPETGPDGWNMPIGVPHKNIAGESILESMELIDALCDVIPPDGLFMELGAFNAATSTAIATRRPDVKTFAVDCFRRCWNPEPISYPSMMLATVNTLTRPNTSLLIADIRDIAKILAPKCLDVVFVDGDHVYPRTLEDLQLAGRLVRDGGVVAAHDYVECHPGVIRGIDEFLTDGWVIERKFFSLVIMRRLQKTD